MNICQFSSSFPPIKDGVGDFVFKLHNLLLKNDIKSYILTSNKVVSDKYIYNFFNNYSIAEVIKSRLLLKKMKIDAIILHYPSTFYGLNLVISFIPLIYRAMGFRVILYLHEFTVYKLKGKIRILPMLLFSKKIITTDFENKRLLEKIINKNKIVLIPGGINFDERKISNFRKIENIESKISLVFFGFIKYGKGVEKLIEVFCPESNCWNKFTLTLIGSIPDTLDEASKILLKKIKTNTKIRNLGFLEWQVFFEEMEQMDAMILPYSDGLSEKRGSFMTAMALGIPVITTKPTTEISGLKNWFNIIYIEKYTVEEIINTLNKFNELTKDQKTRIGESGKKWYLQNHSERIIFNKIMNVVDNVCS